MCSFCLDYLKDPIREKQMPISKLYHHMFVGVITNLYPTKIGSDFLSTFSLNGVQCSEWKIVFLRIFKSFEVETQPMFCVVYEMGYFRKFTELLSWQNRERN